VGSSSVSGANKGEEANKKHHQEREVAIELKRGYGPGPMILRVPLAPQRVVPSAHSVHRAPLGHPAREEGKAHLEKPCSVENEADAAAQFGNTGARRSHIEKRAEKADCDGNQQEIIVTVLDAAGVLALKVEEEKLLGESEEANEAVQRRREREERKKGVEEEDEADGEDLELKRGADGVV